MNQSYRDGRTSSHRRLTIIDTSTVLNGFKINNATVNNQITYIYKGAENAYACACDLIIAKWIASKWIYSMVSHIAPSSRRLNESSLIFIYCCCCYFVVFFYTLAVVIAASVAAAAAL